MNIYLRQKVQLEYDGDYWFITNMSKEIDSDFIPRKGDFIQDELYQNTNFIYEVDKVVIDYRGEACYVDMKHLTVDLKELMIERAQFIEGEDKLVIGKFWINECELCGWDDHNTEMYTDKIKYPGTLPVQLIF